MKISFIDPTGPDYESNQLLSNYITTKCEAGKAIAFQFYSLFMYGIQLNHLIPRKDIMQYLNSDIEGDENTRQFDILYADQLLNDRVTFYDLMTMISPLQMYEEILVISNYNHPNVTPIIDSIIKFIQQRYGLESYIINYPEDIDPFVFSEFKTDIGYQTYIKDFEWFIKTLNSEPDVNTKRYLMKTLKLYNKDML